MNYERTHNCSELGIQDQGKTVRLSGWVHRRRDHGGLIFIDLRDRFGLTQLVFNPVTHPESHKQAEHLRSEWVITVQGIVKPRAAGMANPNLKTGEIEIQIESLEVLSKAKTPPFSISDESIDVNEEARLKYRYLDIRRGDIQKKLVLRHQLQMLTRKYFDALNFIEIATPILGKSTPEGSRDYLIPSRISLGSFYALPQSPQLFKQLLMVAGMERYFQIATCFRDEDLRADRQPEFTQIDIEMSFSRSEELYSIIEGFLKQAFETLVGHSVKTPFKRLTHTEALERYGTDKPDLRFGLEMKTVTSIASRSSFGVFQEACKAGFLVKGFKVDKGAELSRKMIDDYTAFVGRFGVKGLAWMKRAADGLQSSIVKFFDPTLQKELIDTFDIQEGDLIFMIADTEERTNQALDHLRRKLARDLGLIPSDRYEFLWVTDFPLFQFNADEKRLESVHHPFTSPHPDDLPLLATDPLKVRSSGYDIVLNGYEIGGGSQRIHSSELQQNIFEALELSPEEIQEKFGFFVEALSYGTPPHLGIALGLDRLMMLLSGTENIRDVIAFPKTQKASDLMMDCPSEVTPRQLDELKLSIQKKEMFL